MATSQDASIQNASLLIAAMKGSDTMHIQYLYTLEFLEFEMHHLEDAVKSYKEICKNRLDQGNERAWMEHRQMERIEQRVLEAKRKAQRSANSLLE